MTRTPTEVARPRTVGVQSIVYKTDVDAVAKTLRALDNSARIGLEEGRVERVEVILGDSSPERVISPEMLDEITAGLNHLAEVRYDYFDENTGTAKGHNRLARLHECTFIVTSNPDVVPEPRALWHLLETFDDPRTGMAEAKQIPVEHPKDYDVETGETGWAATAFAMTPRDVFDAVGGFDESTFFMYCDDVDYSWLVREKGLAVIFQPAAVVFHDKRLSLGGAWQPTSAEHFYSAQASLLLAHKWSREDIVETVAAAYETSDVEQFKAALEEFRGRVAAGALVAQHDPENEVAMFEHGFYAPHRYAL